MPRTNADELLSLSREEMRKLGYRVVDMIVEHIETLPARPVGRKAARAVLERQIREPLPERAADPDLVLRHLEETILSNIVHVDHPRFFAFIPSPSNFVSVLGDALASGLNVFAGTWLEGSGPAQLELVVVDWLRELCGFPDGAGGLFVSGGSVANLTALAVAREAKLRGRMEGAVVYFSDQTHVSIDRGLRILGFRPEQIRRLVSDADGRLPPADLERAIEADRSARKTPFCVVANAGTTSTGAVDPLPELASLCREEGLWLHVDGAYGAAAVLCERGRRLLVGLERADSLSLDPHKWLFQPFEIGCVLVREAPLLRASFLIAPEYLMDLDSSDEEVNFCHWGIQLTRSFRALKLWLSFKVFGLERFRKAVEHGLEMAEGAEAEIRMTTHLRLVTPAQTGIVTCRFEPSGWAPGPIDALQPRIAAEMMADGLAMVSSTVVKGRTALHLCFINPRTTAEDVRATMQKIEAIGTRLAQGGAR